MDANNETNNKGEYVQLNIRPCSVIESNIIKKHLDNLKISFRRRQGFYKEGEISS